MREHLLSGRAAVAELSALTLDTPTEPRRRRSAA
jgi:hypothetical protein